MHRQGKCNFRCDFLLHVNGMEASITQAWIDGSIYVPVDGSVCSLVDRVLGSRSKALGFDSHCWP